MISLKYTTVCLVTLVKKKFALAIYSWGLPLEHPHWHTVSTYIILFLCILFPFKCSLLLCQIIKKQKPMVPPKPKEREEKTFIRKVDASYDLPSRGPCWSFFSMNLLEYVITARCLFTFYSIFLLVNCVRFFIAYKIE